MIENALYTLLILGAIAFCMWLEEDQRKRRAERDRLLGRAEPHYTNEKD